MSNQIITIESGIELKASDVISVFSDQKKLAPYIEKIREAVQATEIDLTTDKGRKEIASRAHRVSKMKTALTKAAADSVAELKAQVQAVSQGSNFIKEALDSLRDETRRPLNEWEAEQKRIEEERVNSIKAAIQGIHELGRGTPDDTIESLSSMIEALNNIDCSTGFDEFAAEALRAVASSRENLSNMIQQIIAKNQQEEFEREQAKLAKEREEFERMKADMERQKAELEAMKREQETPSQPKAQQVIEQKAKQPAETSQYQDIANFLFKHYGLIDWQAESIAKAIMAGDVPHVTVINKQSKAA